MICSFIFHFLYQNENLKSFVVGISIVWQLCIFIKRVGCLEAEPLIMVNLVKVVVAIAWYTIVYDL